MDQALVSLLAAAVAFVGLHFALSHPLRPSLVSRLGESGFRLAYSLVALASSGWCRPFVRSARAGRACGTEWAGFRGCLQAADAGCVGFIGRVVPGEPRASRSARTRTCRERAAWRLSRHPASHDVVLRYLGAVPHPAQPTARQFVLAGAIALLALLGAHMQDQKKESLMGEAWREWESQTAYWPRLTRLHRAGGLAWAGGIAIWLAASYAHIHANAIPAGIWRWL